MNVHFERLARTFLTNYPSFDEPGDGGMSDKPWFIQTKTPALSRGYPDVYPYYFDSDLIADRPAVFDWSVQSQTPRAMVIKQFARMMASLMAVDRMIGVVARKLSAQNRLENTVIVFTSDNGYSHGQHRLSSKVLAYEDSARIPLLVSLPSLSSRQVSYALLLNNDLAPTFLDLAKDPSITPGMNIPGDGASFKPLLRNPSATWRHQALSEQYIPLWSGEPNHTIVHPTSFAVRTSIHHPYRRSRKYVEYFTGVQYGPTKTWNGGFYLCPAENDACSPVRAWAYDPDGANLVPRGVLGAPGGREYYNLSLDPFENNNGYWSGAPASIRNTGRQDCTYLKAHLNLLTSCSGIGCAYAEWATNVGGVTNGECPE